MPTALPSVFRTALAGILLSTCLGALAQDPVAATGTSAAQEPVTLTPFPADLRDAMLAGDGRQALRLVTRYAADQPKATDFWLYAEACALKLAQRPDDAIERLEALERNHADSHWLSKARFLRADLLRAGGHMAAAEQVFEEEARRLRGDGRQSELAAIYLDFAHKLVTEPEETTAKKFTPDWIGAFQLFQRVLDLDAPVAQRALARFEMGRCRFELGEFPQAREQYQTYLKDFGEEGQRGAQALLRAAESSFHSGALAQARRELVNLDLELGRRLGSTEGDSERAPGGPEASPAEREELSGLRAEALFLLARAWKSESNQADRVVAVCRSFLERFPDHARTQTAAWWMATVPMEQGRNEDALAGLDQFLQRVARTAADDEERQRLERNQQHGLFLKAQVLGSLGRLQDSIATLDQYIGRFPSGADWAAAQKERLDTEYRMGAELRSEHRYEEARAAWQQFLFDHPLDERGPAIVYHQAETYLDEVAYLSRDDAPERPDPAQIEQLRRTAVDHWEQLSHKFANSAAASQALFLAGDQLENHLFDLPEAIRLYRLCNFGPSAIDAGQRLATMTSEELRISTERTWRSNEKAKVRVQVRNSEKLSVSLYRLDLQAYFRKHLTHTRIEDLDLDLIAPDHSFEVDVKDYQRYKPVQQDIELPVSGPGVWAVAVSDGERRATTLVLHSDLDVVVKSSRREFFLYAQDMRLGQPAADVEVLLALPGQGANGSPLLQTLTTGADGVARLSLDQLAAADGLRVLATREGHYCGEGMDLNGLALARGLEARGFVYTDRPAYRPGQRVSWRAILRQVEAGSYTFHQGEEFRVQIDDPHGRPALRKQLALSRFGTLGGGLDLGAEATEGSWSIRCTSADGRAYQGSFQVQRFQLQKARLELEFDQPLVFRGEVVHGAVVAAWNYGEPLVDTPVTLSFPDGRSVVLRTNAEGEAEFEFDPADLVEGRSMPFSATLAEERLYTTGRVYFALTGYRVGMKLESAVALAGSSIPVRFSVSDPLGEALARSFELQLIERQERGGGWVEVIRERWPVQSDEQGAGSHTLAVAEGGHYLLRAVGSDRFGNPVRAEQELFVSGEADEVRLRLLARQTEVEVGEEVAVQLVNRASAGLALVTFEGESVLDYRILDLKLGSNDLDFVADHPHYPNFVLAVAQMDANRFHSAEVPFEVRRHLNIEMLPQPKEWAPGAKAGVEVRVTDQRGRPVVAELSLSVVDEGLLDLFPDKLPRLNDFFGEGAHRHAALRTLSTCGFSYKGYTGEIAQAILDEEVRLAQDAKWKEGRAALIEGLKLAESGQLFAHSGLDPMEEAEIDAEDDFDSDSWNNAIGLGGGAGGKFGKRGGRGGGRRGGGALSQSLEVDAASAFWSGTLVTDAEGHARVEFPVPNKSTRWRMTARAVGSDTLLGDGRTQVIARQDFFVELRTPLALMEGDRPHFLARVHHLGEGAIDVDLRLRVLQGRDLVSLPAEVHMDQPGVAEVLFPMSEGVVFDGPLQLTLSAAGSDEGAGLNALAHAVVPVRPWGVELADARAGSLRADEILELELDEATLRSQEWSLELTLGDDRMLIDAALGRDTRPVLRSGSGGKRLPLVAAAAGRLLGSCAVLELIESRGTGAGEDYRQLRQLAAGQVSALVALQREDGGWGWTGRNSDSRVAESGQSVLALARARALGLLVPDVTLESATAYLNTAFQQAGQQADEEKALLVYALAVLDKDDFGAANRLHRERHNLSPAALAHTALALIEMERSPMAADLAPLLVAQLHPADGRCAVAGNRPAWRNSLTMTALASLVLQATAVDPAAAERTVEALLAARPWPGAQQRGWALAAVSMHHQHSAPRAAPAVVQVEVDGETTTFRLNDQVSAAITGGSLNPAAQNGRGRVRIALSVQGGAIHYSAVLRGFTRGMPATPISEELRGMHVGKYVLEAPAPEVDGRPVDTGFDLLSDDEVQWYNQAGQVPMGATVRASLYWDRGQTGVLPPGEREDLILHLPIPAGMAYVRGSWSGSSDGVIQVGEELQVPLGIRTTGALSYRLAGALPGNYRAAPAWLEKVSDPAFRLRTGAIELEILNRDQSSADPYRATPDELFHLGFARLKQGERGAAFELLTSLFEQFHQDLRDEHATPLVRSLLFLALDLGEAQQVVSYFEILKERDPSLNVPFADVMRVADAYRDLEEYERALLIFRAVVEETFGRELKLVGDLEARGERLGSAAMLQRLWLEYPDLPVVVESYLGLADRLLQMGPGAHRDERLVAAGWGRSELTLAGILALNGFLALYPDDPLAADAALNLVSARLEIEDYAGAAELAAGMAAHFERPRYQDAFRYTQAVAQWSQGKDSAAMKLLQSIADAVYTLEGGINVHSENRNLALYILGQIHHARQEIDQAGSYYEQVEELFADARECLQGFRHKSIEVPEVTAVSPGERVEFELSYRNVAEADLLVYPVNLMTLYLRERDLSRVTAVNLAGIAPAYRAKVKLGGDTTLREESKTVRLPLKDPGAYLVICRGDALHASGLVLVSDIELVVQEDSAAQQLRVQVLKRGEGGYQRDVDVRVVGSQGGTIHSGLTDPRGIFSAEGVAGTSTVIARHDGGHYAFFRGERLLGQADVPNLASDAPAEKLGSKAYFRNVLELNDANIQSRQQRLKKEQSRDRAGVRVDQTDG